MSRHSSHPVGALAGLAVALMLLAPGPLRASPPLTYKGQIIAHAGDTIGGVKTSANGHFYAGGLNDRGQLVFSATVGAGEALFEYSDGVCRPIVVPGQPSPEGTWPLDAGIDDPASLNQSGNVVFGVHENSAPAANLGTYRYDAQTGQTTVIAAKGMAAINSLTFEAGSYWFPTLNRSNEIAFPAWVRNAAGKAHVGLFFRAADGPLQPVALPDDLLPGGLKVVDAGPPVINDAGMVAFTVIPAAGKNPAAYLWEKGTVSPVVLGGTAAPGGGRINQVDTAWVNNQNRSVLLSAQVLPFPPNGDLGDSLFLWTDGLLKAVAIREKGMPGGGQFDGIDRANGVVSFANEAGQHAFIAHLEDTSTAAYLMDADGSLSLIVQPGMTLDLGTVAQVGEGSIRPSSIALNSAGQVALTLRVTGQPRALVLLTPDTL